MYLLLAVVKLCKIKEGDSVTKQSLQYSKHHFFLCLCSKNVTLLFTY